MRVICKKILVSTILIVMLFNCIFGTNTSFAGTAEEWINSITNAIGGIVSVMYWPLRIKMVAISFVIGEVVVTSIAKADGGDTFFVTPFEVFFNKVTLTNPNFFDTAGADTASAKFRTKVAQWYYNVRAIALGGLLVVGVYVGIRMALSTLSEDKAKYKRMLTDFVMSIALLFLMQYIILFILEFNNVIVLILEKMVNSLEGEMDVEGAMWTLAGNALIGIGINSLTSTFAYTGIVILTFCFVIAYINRMLKVGFLIIISPLITITYAMDKMKDNKSQALDTWFKELLYTILIQPFHCIIYMSYISVCLGLLTNGNTAFGWGSFLGTEYNRLAGGILAIFCLLFIKQAEKIVRTIFGFKDDDSKTSFAAGVAKSAMVLSAIPKAGTAARQIGGKVGAIAGAVKGVGGDAARLAGAVRNSEFAKKIGKTGIGKAGKALGDKVAPSMAELKNKLSEVNESLSNASRNVKKTITGVKKGMGKVADKVNVPKRFYNKLNDKYNKILGDEKASLKEKTKAARRKNRLNRFKNNNSTAAAIGHIAAMGTLVSKDNAFGQAMATQEKAQEAAQNYKNGSSKQLEENIRNSTAGRDAILSTFDQESSVDAEETAMENDLVSAVEAKKTAKEEYKKNPTEDNKKKYLAALNRETLTRRALTSKRKNRDKDVVAKSNAKGKFHSILNKGKKGAYKIGSKEETKIRKEMTTTFKGVLESEVQNGSISRREADKLEKEFEIRMNSVLNTIDYSSGLVENFDEKAVQDLFNSNIKSVLNKIPAFQTFAQTEVAVLEKSFEKYRKHRDEGFVYGELAKFEAGGGNVDSFVERMYKYSK